jgi:hypothetical protein
MGVGIVILRAAEPDQESKPSEGHAMWRGIGEAA